ncbi:MAG: SRPBCC family protein [Cyanobacteria bacterium P01_G01_bin.54]
MADWLEHSVQIEVSLPRSQAWDCWAKIEQMPQWMLWLDSVKELEDDPNLSRWTLSGLGFSFSWLARIFKKIPGQIIQWESVDGLPNRGAIRFYDQTADVGPSQSSSSSSSDRNPGSIVRLTVSYAIPGVVGQVMDNLFLGQLVEKMLQESLEKFRDYAQKQIQSTDAPQT